MLQKKFISLYLQHLSFLIKRTDWKASKLYSHYTFEQERFKKDFILMNQRSRQQILIEIKGNK